MLWKGCRWVGKAVNVKSDREKKRKNAGAGGVFIAQGTYPGCTAFLGPFVGPAATELSKRTREVGVATECSHRRIKGPKASGLAVSLGLCASRSRQHYVFINQLRVESIGFLESVPFFGKAEVEWICGSACSGVEEDNVVQPHTL